jgi:hypothetical protein
MPIPTPTLDVNGRYPFENEFRRKEELKGTHFGAHPVSGASWETALQGICSD